MATITEENGGLQACSEALVLLRQDKDLPVSEGELDVSTDVVARKVSRIYDSTRAIVLSAHGWDGLTLTDGDNANVSEWPKPIRSAFVACLARELALPITGRREDLKAAHELYEAKLNAAIKCDFEQAVARETDKLSLAVYAVCRGFLKDGEPLPWGWAAFKSRVGDAKVAALTEIGNAHGWSSEFTGEENDWRYPAYERLVTAKVAASVGAGVEQQNLLLQAYLKAIDEAASENWRRGISGEENRLVAEVFSGIQGRSADANYKDWDYRRMRACLLAAADRMRIRVLSERDWNFARRRLNVFGRHVMQGNRLVTPIPPGCIKIHSVEDCHGMSLARGGWWIEDGQLVCWMGLRPASVSYTADVKKVERWDPLVRDAYVTLLMREVAASAPEINVRIQVLETEYAELIRRAAVNDARETQPGRDPWGPNVYADAICGGEWHWRRRPV